jgi:hypothetical protein
MSPFRVSSRAPIARPARRLRCPLALLVVALLLAACAGPGAEATPTATAVPTEAPSQPEPSAAPEATATSAPRTATSTRAPTATATLRPTPTITSTRRPTSVPTGPTETPVVLSNPSTLTQFLVGEIEGDDKVAPLLAVGGRDGKTLFAGRAGVARSSDGGVTWKAVRGVLETPKVTALAVAPSKPEILYVGVSQKCVGATRQPGYVSDNSGDTWRAIGDNIVALAVDPQEARTVYAIDCEGFKRSSNSGQTWETLTAPKISGGTKAIISIAPSNTDHIYIAVPLGTSTMSIIHSADRGATWKGVTPAIVADLDEDKVLPGGDKNVAKAFPQGVAVDADDALTALVSTTFGVFRTEDGGATWRRLDSGLENTIPKGALPQDQNGSRLTTALLADPDRSGSFWVGTGADKAKGVGLYRTRNSGESWRKPVNGLEGKRIHALAVGGTSRERVLYISTDDGVWVLTAP